MKIRDGKPEVVLLVFGLFLWLITVVLLVSGSIPVQGGGAFSRDDEPMYYWFGIGVHALAGAGFVFASIRLHLRGRGSHDD